MDRSQIKIEYWHDFGLHFVLSGFPHFSSSLSSVLLSLLVYCTEKWVRFSKLNVNLTQKPNKQNKNANNNISSGGSNTNETKKSLWLIYLPFSICQSSKSDLVHASTHAHTPMHTQKINRCSWVRVYFFAPFISKIGQIKRIILSYEKPQNFYSISKGSKIINWMKNSLKTNCSFNSAL